MGEKQEKGKEGQEMRQKEEREKKKKEEALHSPGAKRKDQILGHSSEGHFVLREQ